MCASGTCLKTDQQTLYRYLQPSGNQLPQCTATISKQPLASIYVYIICTWSKSQVSEVLHDAVFALHTQRQSCYYLQAIEERFTDKLYSICLMSCQAWLYQTCVAREHERLATSLALRRAQLARLGRNPRLYRRPGLQDQHQEQKHCVYSHFWTSETPSHRACVFGVQTIE